MYGEMFANAETTSDREGAAHSAASHNTGAASSFAAAYPVPAPVVCCPHLLNMAGSAVWEIHSVMKLEML
jgi:hypothetical protein